MRLIAGTRASSTLFWLAMSLFSATGASAQKHIPLVTATALDGHSIAFPQNLGSRATVLILGFSRGSADATTPWEKAVRTQVAHRPEVEFYDMAMLAGVPSLFRSWAIRGIRKQVPDVLKPNFLPLLDHEAEWKEAAGYDKAAPDAAYLLVVDRSGTIRWATHEKHSAEALQRLTSALQGTSVK